MGEAHRYATAILHRGRVPMEPVGFEPDWTDRPRKWKHFPGVESYPLPDADPGAAGASGTARAGLLGADGEGRFGLAQLGGMLRDTYGLLGRRLGIQANTDLAALPSYTHANWHRGTASGGGLYPVTVTFVTAGTGPLLPGAYHYSPAQHALQRLLTGDVTARVRAALGTTATEGAHADHFLVLGVKYWQNAFKYNSFCFHAVSMDVGAATHGLRTWARAAGLAAEPHWWFDEGSLARLLGLDDGEGVFAVVPLRWHDDEAATARRAPSSPGAEAVRVTRRPDERSRTVLRFADVDAMQAATRQDSPGTPAPDALSRAALTALPRPDAEGVPMAGDPALLDVPLRSALRRRRSSFGRFDAREPLGRTALGTVLEAADHAARDVLGSTDARLVRLYVFACHVDQVEPGTYAYEPESRGLHLVVPGDPGRFLQDSYFLANYNLEQAGAVVVPAVRTAAVLDAVGDRGYRLVNASIGAVAQAGYVAAAATGTGCGVALGFDGVSYVEHLGLAGSGEVPLLLMMLGGERPGEADFRYEIA